MSQRPINQGLQGLRGIAILLVLLNHAGLPGFDGGYVGVDLFFVISGFLIGGLLLREQTRTGHIDLWAFYARRFKRLLPACALLLLVVTAAIPWLYAPMEQGELLSSARASTLYAANLWFASRTTDYFGGHTEANPLLHLWSLAVEEQFYLFWPLFMLLAHRLCTGEVRRNFLVLVFGLGGLSLVACLVVTEFKVQYAFFLTPMRVWEFAAGMWLAARPACLERLGSRSLQVIGLASMALLVGVTLRFDAKLQFPGAWAILPVLSAMGLLMVVAQPLPTWTTRVLEFTPLRWLGDCSYSVYLWHWPVLIGASLLFTQHSPAVAAGLVALSVLLGWLSYQWIELPFKHGWGQPWSARRVVIAGLAVCLALAALAHILGRREVGADQARYQQAAVWPVVTKTGCLVGFDAVDSPPCEFGASDAKRTLVLFGDSHSMQWFVPLKSLAEQQGWRFVALAKAACPSIDLVVAYYTTRAEYWQCSQWRSRMFERIAALKPDLIVLASSSGYGVGAEQWQAGLSATVQRMQDSGAAVAYVRDTPFPGFNVPVCLARANWRGDAPERLCSFERAAEEARVADLLKAETQALRETGAEFIDLFSQVCASTICTTERDGAILFMDRNHITEAFAQTLQPALSQPLLRLMHSRP
jgi:peptidoglycan/LPS O-acetylase OafA/YrhL